MITPLKDDVWDLNNLATNLSNQVEAIQVEDILWCHSRITKLERLNNPANCFLWELLNHFVCQVEDQEDKIAGLKARLVQSQERIGILEMLSAMICT
jgi:hypothetical protein